MIEPSAGFEGVGLVEGNDDAGAEIEGEIDSAGIGDRRVFGEDDRATVHIEDGFAAPVVMRNDFGAEREAGAIGVFARAIDVVGVESERFQISVPAEGEVAKSVPMVCETNAKDEEALILEAAHDERIAKGLASVKGEFAIAGRVRTARGGRTDERGRGGIGGVGGEIRGWRLRQDGGRCEKE